MSFTMRVKFALLACAMIVSTGSSCSEASNTVAKVGASICAHNKFLSSFAMGLALFAYIDLKTQGRKSYVYGNFQEDLTNLLNAYNIFDAESRATIKQFYKKYFIGAELKLDDQMIRVKEEDGTVVTTKRKKITQIPSGVVGLIDAYVLQQMKNIADLLPAAAAFYLLTRTPQGSWSQAQEKVLAEKYLALV